MIRRLWRWWFPLEGFGRVQWPTRAPLCPPPSEGGKSVRDLFREMERVHREEMTRA